MTSNLRRASRFVGAMHRGALVVAICAVAAAAWADTAGDAVVARLTPSTLTPYAGEVFDIEQTITMAGRSGQVVGPPTWQPGLPLERWSDGEQVRTPRGAGVRFRTRAVAPQAGRIELAPAEQEVQVETGRRRIDPFAELGGAGGAFGALRRFGGSDLFDSFFSEPQLSAVVARSNAVQLDVQPLPVPAPADFTGAVGQFELETAAVPAQVKTGDPITWTVTLKGTGNWPAVGLPARAVPAALRTLQPRQQKDFGGGLFSGSVSEDLVLIPDQPGALRLEPVRFTYFDPAAGAYRTLEARPPQVQVTGAPIAAASVPAAAPAAAAAGPSQAETGVLPRDPRAGAAPAAPPLPARTLVGLAAAPFLLVLAVAAAVVIWRARRADPRRPRRLAWRRLRPAVARVAVAHSAEERAAALLAWQQTAALALGIDRAAPTADQLSDPRWRAVWEASERALYAPAHELAPAWSEDAVALARPGARRWLQRFHGLGMRQMLVRSATATAASLVLLATAVRAADAPDPLAAYAAGDFATARGQLEERVEAHPTDWIARYDLGLAEAQLGRPARALAHTLAALLHAPGDGDVRWNATAFAPAVPGLDRGAAALIARAGLGAALSPARWQHLLLAGAVLGCAGLGGLFVTRRRTARGGAGAAIALGCALAVAAALALRGYGMLADPRAVMITEAALLRSVPTDAEQPQRQRQLAAGTVAVVERDFLGWVKIGLGDGETGWLRRGDLVALYGPSRSG